MLAVTNPVHMNTVQNQGGESLPHFSAEIYELEASNAKLTEEITELTKAVAELDAADTKATSVREEEKASNIVMIKEFRDAQTAVAQAFSVVGEFYAKTAEVTSFVQEPEIFDEPYKGIDAENLSLIHI